jgi:3-deoxy-7-phosphoheptulonate synthase
VVLAKSDALPGPKHKSSLIFSVGDHPGALFEALQVFAAHGINLSKLESRPIHDRPWEYLFYVDAEADLSAESNRPLLEQLKSKTEFFKYLGSYQQGGAAPREAGTLETGPPATG